ncbi:MAG: MFS transporter [Pseudomonadota bacterium]
MKEKHSLLAWLMWLIAATFYALDYFQHTAPSVLIEPIANSLNISLVTVGNIMSIYFPIYAIAQLPAGYLLDKFGIKYPLAIACLVVSLGLYMMIMPSQHMLIIGRILIAVGSSFAFIGALKTASLWLPQSIFPIAVGMINTIGVIGGMLGQALLNYMIIDYDWKRATIYISIFGIIIAALILIFLRSPNTCQKQFAVKFNKLTILKDKNIWLLAIYAGIMVGTVVNAFSELYDVIFLENSFHISSEKAAIISSMIFCGIAVGGPLHGIIANYFKQKRTWMLTGCAMTIILFAMIVFSAKIDFHVSLMFILYFLTGFFVSSMLLSFSIARCCYSKQVHATIFALINTVIGLCGFIFQFLLGESIEFISKHSDHHYDQHVFFMSFWILLIPLLFSLFMCYKTRRI